jgi:hypothetical protein
MVSEWICEFLEKDAYVWRCVNCGAIVDPAIRKDRDAEINGRKLARRFVN